MNNHEMFFNKLHSICSQNQGQRTAATFAELAEAHKQIACPVTDSSEPIQQDVVALFQHNAIPLNLHVHRCSDWQDAAATIAAIAQQAGLEFTAQKEIIAHDHPDLRQLDLGPLLAKQRIPFHLTSGNGAEIQKNTRNSFIGITAADWGVAESATLIQLTTEGRPRSTSLVPSIHIGVLPINRLLATLEQAYAMLMNIPLPDSFVFISGPSKTADIEAHMVHGAHGPKEMHTILVDTEGNAV